MSEDGRIVIETGLDMSGLKKDVEGLKDVFKSSGLEASLSTLKSAVADLDKAVERMDRSTGKASKTMKTDMGGAAKDASQDLGKVSKESKKAEKELTSLGKKGSEVASLLKKGFAAIGVTKVLGWLKDGIAGIAEETGSFANTLRGASTLFGDVEVDIEKLGSNMLEMSSRLGINADELGQSLYSALSAGIPATEDMGEALAFLEASAKTAKGGFTDVDTVVTATASIMNAYGLTVKDVERIQGILMQTQNKGITTVGELGASLAQVVPTAASFGVSFEQVGAALATMTASGTKTAQATTGLNAMLAELGKNGQQADKNLRAAARAAGLGEQSFQSMIDEGYTITDILQLLQKRAERSGKTLLDMFGSVEAGKAALQLASDGASKFNDNLKAMEETGGLVDNAFQTMQTGIDRFKVAVDNAKKKIGTEFLGSVDDAAGSLATMIDRLTGNTMAADDLEGSLNDVVTATEAYRKAQESARTATDETTQAMLDQSAASLKVALDNLSSTFNDTERDSAKQREDIVQYGQLIDNANMSLDSLAAGLKVSRMELARLATTGELTGDQLAQFEFYTGQVNDYTAALHKSELKLEENDKKLNKFKVTMATLYRDGKVDLQNYAITNRALYDSVMELADSFERGKEFEMDFLNASEKNADVLKDRIEYIENIRKAVDESSPSYQFLTGRLEVLTAAYEDLGFAIKGVNEAEAASPAGGGKNPSGRTGGSPGRAASSHEASAFSVKLGGNWQKEVKDIYESTINGIFEINRAEEVFGETTETAAQKVALIKSAIVKLGAYGGLGAEAIKDFEGILDSLVAKGPVVGDFFRQMKDYFKDIKGFASDAADAFANILVSSFQTLGKELASKDEQVKNLAKDIEDAKDNLADKQESLLDAQAELNDAQARGNEEDIKSAEKKVKRIEAQIDGINEVIKAKNNEKTSVESGESAWKAFGRTALSALAQVLYGVGAQLAAESVLRAIALDWAGAGIAAAGSAAAIAAGVGLDIAAGSFEQGGIVPQKAGVPSTGDRHIARVNPGELILSEAQQSNLADQIKASRQRFEEPSGSAQRSIVVNLAGAQIYGLDEPAVGRAIYENIRTLSSEGVL